jgi:hypothetical protein
LRLAISDLGIVLCLDLTLRLSRSGCAGSR